MASSPCFHVRVQVQSDPSSCSFAVFSINSNSNGSCRQGWCRPWCEVRQVPINLVVAAPLRLSSSRLLLLSASACPPHSVAESLKSDAIPQIQENFNHNDSYNNEGKKKKKKRKPRPSFHDLTLQRWSRHISSQRQSFPWQTNPLDSSSSHDLSDEGALDLNFPNLGDKPQPKAEVHSGEATSSVATAFSFPSENRSTSSKETKVDPHQSSSNWSASPKVTDSDSYPSQIPLERKNTHQIQTGGTGKTLSDRPMTLTSSVLPSASAGATSSSKSRPKPADDSIAELMLSSVALPWERHMDRDRATVSPDENQNESSGKSNTELAERTMPELELRRLRNAALRMKERMKVGPAGVTESIVRAIHDKWTEEEVVKLRFEGPPSLNMTRTHELLEGKTGGIVIWRSGKSLVLYRGMSYEFPCVKSYATSKSVATDQNQNQDHIPLSDKDPSHGCSDSSHESSSGTDALATESLLDGLGPRYMDWSGRGPVPVDADLLPGRVPGYKTPFRLLPYKTRRTLRDVEMTALRRLARSMPPHFALGRNREHQGLAAAIVKFWDKSAIAKIAIKRGVPSTSNERMAEEIKKLTGGTLLSRNKDFIVLYRGNDFVTPSVRSALLDKERQVIVRQDDEELAREKALNLLSSDSRPVNGRYIAGTLTETTEAASRWGHDRHLISEEEKEEMRRDLAVSKHASLVRCFEEKLERAKVKFAKAEKALAKVQKALIPTGLPTDLETVTDEERSKYRSIGLKMKAFLSLGRREVFDGTIQNMHLNWKHKELVKVIVKRKSFPQVKHIAISLEAESGGVLISVDKTTKGYAIVLYRGKNYQRPLILRPKNLLTRRQALARSIELQRREALKHHMFVLQGKIQTLKDQLEQMKTGAEIKENHRYLQETDNSLSDDDFDEEGEEAYLETYTSGDEDCDYDGHSEII